MIADGCHGCSANKEVCCQVASVHILCTCRKALQIDVGWKEKTNPGTDMNSQCVQ